MSACKNAANRTTCLLTLGFLVGACAVGVPRAEGAPLSGSFGANYYQFVQVADPFTGTNNAWSTASTAAAAMTFNSVNGHLATITSQAENDFLFGLVAGDFSGFAGAWLGGKWPQGWLVGPESGQAFSYTNWPVGGLDPNNNGYVYMSIGTITAPSHWLDDSNLAGQGVPSTPNDPVIGYFVEFEGAVPEPSSLLLAGLALTLSLLARPQSGRC